MSSLAAKRYAKSLLSIALEKNALESVYKDMVFISETIASSRDLKVLLNNPIVKVDKKRAIIAILFSKSTGDITASFFDLISNTHREGILGDIAESFIAEYRAYNKIITVEISSAVKLSNSQLNEIVQLIVTDKSLKVEIAEKVDPTLIGGFIVRMGDQQIDSSVTRKLNSLKLQLSKPISVN